MFNNFIILLLSKGKFPFISSVHPHNCHKEWSGVISLVNIGDLLAVCVLFTVVSR